MLVNIINEDLMMRTSWFSGIVAIDTIAKSYASLSVIPDK